MNPEERFENPVKWTKACEYNSQMLPSDLSALTTFLVVAEERSFTRAAKRQGVSPSAVSHSMRALEEDVGVRLLARTTRSVSLTEAGEQLLGRLRPPLPKSARHWKKFPEGGTKLPGVSVFCCHALLSDPCSCPNSAN